MNNVQSFKDFLGVMKALHDAEKSSHREMARKVLVDKGHYWMPQLLRALRDRDPETRYHAASALGELGDKAKEAMPALVSLLDDENEWVRYYACYALSKIKGNIPELAELLSKMTSDRSWHVRQAAIDSLSQLGYADDGIIHAITEALNDSKWQVRSSAAEAVGILGIWRDQMMMPFEEMLVDQESMLRLQAIETLGKVGASMEWVIRRATRMLYDDDYVTRTAAAKALSRGGTAAIDAIPDLLENLSISTLPDYTRNAMRSALTSMGKKAISLLVRALNDDRSLVRAEASQVLGDMGEVSAIAAAHISRAMDDSHDLVRVCAAGAFWKLTGDFDKTCRVLMNGLESQEPTTITRAASLLGRMGKNTNAVIKKLKRAALAGPDDSRGASTVALIRLTRHEDTSAPLLITLLESKDYELRLIAVRGLGIIKCATPEVNSTLAKHAHFDWDPDVRAAAARSLKLLRGSQ